MQQPQIDSSPHSHDINERLVRRIGSNVYNLPRHCQAHSASSRRFNFFILMIHLNPCSTQESFFALTSNEILSSSFTFRAPPATETSLILKSDCLMENSP